ncbi:unnamed protein product [Dovyalis caffra]|uniref:Uncharacterized protein n=1 Tax=Dovyalis caffra TaxID=77055 RepID=A0AAV1R8Y9_9ROSI|nr:unnamed protein product [Dovyalis caffra]
MTFLALLLLLVSCDSLSSVRAASNQVSCKRTEECTPDVITCSPEAPAECLNNGCQCIPRVAVKATKGFPCQTTEDCDSKAVRCTPEAPLACLDNVCQCIPDPTYH